MVALILCPVGSQGRLWQTILRSQGVSVIWESADVDLVGTLASMQAETHLLPSLILVDTQLVRLKPYSIRCWYKVHCPTVKVVLVNGAQVTISLSEREWARYQGTLDILPRLPSQTLVSSAITYARQIIAILGDTKLDSGALVTALLKLGYRKPHQTGDRPISLNEPRTSLTNTLHRLSQIEP